jgi:hypothetical protein
MLTDERLAEIKAFIVVKINECSDAMWETHNAAEKLKWDALKKAYLDMYKRLFNEVYYDR